MNSKTTSGLLAGAIAIGAGGYAVFQLGTKDSLREAYRDIEGWRSQLQQLETRITELEELDHGEPGSGAQRSGIASSRVDGELEKERRSQLEVAKRRAARARALAAAELQLRFSPEMQELRFQHFKAGIALRYGRLYRSLGLSDSETSEFEAIMEDAYWAISGLEATRTKEGMPASDYLDLQGQLLEPLAKKLRELLGDSGYRQYEGYERTSSVRHLVNSIAGNVAHGTADPLTFEQTGRIARIFGDHAWIPGEETTGPLGSSWIRNEVHGSDHFFRQASWEDLDWVGVEAELSEVLTPAQFAIVQAQRAQTEARRDAQALQKGVADEIRLLFESGEGGSANENEGTRQ